MSEPGRDASVPGELARPPVAVIGIGPKGSRTGAQPYWLDALIEAALAGSGSPVAMLLPSVHLVAETCALLCCRRIAREAVVPPSQMLRSIPLGHRVRVLPDGGVYEFAGIENDGFWLHLLDIKNTRTDGRIWAPTKEAARLEPTRRRQPFGGPSRSQWSPLRPTVWDDFAEIRLAGNAGRSRLCVVVIGSRTDFEAVLENVAFSREAGQPGMGVEEGLPWGRVDQEGDLELLHPAAAAGEPLLAIARDHISARRLSVKRPPGSLVFVSARADDALSDRTSVERLAERHACLVVAPGRLREAFLQKRRDGWAVAELSASSALDAVPSGVPALDRVSQISSWMRRPASSLAQSSYELEEAFRLLGAFNQATERYVEEDDDVAEIAAQVQQAFFDVSDWLATPSAADLEDLLATYQSVRASLPRLRSIAGDAASDAALGTMGALELFARAAHEKSVTPKGECLLHLAEKAQSGGSYTQVIVTGHRRNAKAIRDFLTSLGAPMTCVTPAELAGMEVQRINVLSVMHRDAFVRLVDPWAAPEVMFLGYQHEVDIYKRRLRARERSIEALRPDSELERRVPLLQGIRGDGPPATHVPTPVSGPPEYDHLGPPPRRQPQPVGGGELSKQARYCRFAGRSWMAVTDDHVFARVQIGRDQKAQVGSASAGDLQIGDLLLVREGGDKDVVREMAEQIAGPDIYSRLRVDAGLWRRKLRQAGRTAEELRQLLAEEGLERGLPTLRYWTADVGPIGPHDPDNSLPLIASALGEDPASKDWKTCLLAIHTLRKHHVAAGFRLTDVLMQECGSAILEHSEHETPFELSMGTVWLVQVELLEGERRPWPQGQVNRLQWESEAWKRRQLRSIKAGSVTDTADILKVLFPNEPSEL